MALSEACPKLAWAGRVEVLYRHLDGLQGGAPNAASQEKISASGWRQLAGSCPAFPVENVGAVKNNKRG
jgi:hypothetical protein